MKHRIIAVLVIAVTFAISALTHSSYQATKNWREEHLLQADKLREHQVTETKNRVPDPDNPDEAMRWRRLTWADEKGKIPPDALMIAGRQREENIAYWQALSRVQFAGITPSLWNSRGPRNVGGRTRSLIIHPNNPNILWAGSVSGGVWKSTDAGTSWVPVNDFMANLAANCLAMDPFNPNVLYCGTGEGFFNGDGLQGAGIFKTTDAGNTWGQLPSTADWTTTGKLTVNRIAIAPTNSNLILAGTRYGGIQRSTDAGVSWSTTRWAQGSYYLAFHPTDSTKAIAHLIDYDFGLNDWFHNAAYSTDGGATWQNANFTGIGERVSGFGGRIELAYAPSNPNIVYAGFDSGSGGRIWRSTNGGQSYSLMTTSGSAGNSWYNNVLWVSPTNSNFIITGGSPLYKSTDGGATLTQITDGYLITQQPHPDHHFVVAESGFNGSTNKRVYVCNDGGVFRTDNILTASTTSGWVSLNGSYQTTQYYGAAGHGGTGLIIGGTQDNGTLRNPFGSQNATLMFGGDGGFSAVDPTDDTYCYGEYVVLQIHRSQDHGMTSDYIYAGIADAGTNANFIAPLILDPNDPNRMLAGGASLWRSNNVRLGNPPGWAAIRPPGTDKISAIAVATANSNIIWVAQNDGKIVKTINGLATTPSWNTVDDNGAINPLPNRYPTRILIDQSDTNTVYIAFGGFSDGNLQRTTDGGTTWTDVTGSGPTGLPFAPIRGIARNPSIQNWLYVGTEVGVFSSEDGGATWSATNQGPANVSVDEVMFMHSSTVLLAATHGRGLWTASASCVDPIAPASSFFSLSGGPGSVSVTSPGGCSWTAISNDPWIIITSPGGGTGSDTVTYEVRENFTGSARQGTITIAGQTFTAVQDGGLGDDCGYAIKPTFQSFPASGGTATVDVIAEERCAWQASSNVSWITIASGNVGIGNGVVTYSVGANPSATGRKGIITMAGKSFAVKQKGT